MTDKLILLSNYKVTSADTDMYSRLRLGALVNMLIQSAIESADSLGFGLNTLRENGLFWVLSRMELEITNLSTWYDELEVQTWPKDIDRLMYLRDFLVKDKDQNILAKATSGWLAIDVENKRPRIVDFSNTDAFVKLKDQHAIDKSPGKLEPVEKGESFIVPSRYFDIDLNKHVTSTRYVDWMMDAFKSDFHKDHYPRKLNINYLRETMPGEALRVSHKESDSLQYDFEGVNQDHATVAFRGRLIF